MKSGIELIMQLDNAALRGQGNEALMAALRSARPEDLAIMGRNLAKFDAHSWYAGDGEGGSAPQIMRIAMISNFNGDELQYSLRTLLLADGIYPEFYIAPYGQYVEELLNAGSEMYRFDPDVLICLLDEHIVLDALPTPWGMEHIEQQLLDTTAQLDRLLALYQERAGGTVIANTIPLSKRLADQIIDYRTKMRLSQRWREFNIRLLEMVERRDQLLVLELDVMLQRPSAVQLRDERFSSRARMHMSDGLLSGIAAEIAALIRNLAGKTSKVLVLDLDNTLWGGILGEDGLDGIQLGHGPGGEVFAAFQRVILQLKSQGILLAVCSKNDSDVVRQAFAEHPDMVLGTDDLCWLSADWEPKHQNIAAIAEGLNLGLDSFVFVDDSEFERESVRQYLPTVKVIDLPADVNGYIDALLEPGLFNCRYLSVEDYGRTRQYQHEQVRKAFVNGFESMADYLQGLSIRVNLFDPDPIAVNRIAQITQRTNQFNMTTRRMSQQDVAAAVVDADRLVLGIRSGDRFGDNGIVGAVFIDGIKGRAEPVITNFLLSCRVFSRGIESAVLETLLAWFKQREYRSVAAEYISSPKNAKFAEFYLGHGFIHAQQGGASRMVHSLERLESTVDWITMHSDLNEPTTTTPLLEEVN